VAPIGPARDVQIEDRYLDTAAGALRAAGLVARVRTSPAGRRLTLKSVARRGAGAVHRRLELEGDASDGDDPRHWPAGDARDRLLVAAGIAVGVAAGSDAGLVTIAALRQRRLQRDVVLGSSVVELSLDEIEAVLPDGRTDRWTELECELRSGDEADLERLGAALGGRADLAPATTAKLDRALVGGRELLTER